jgi:hypothetical protein
MSVFFFLGMAFMMYAMNGLSNVVLGYVFTLLLRHYGDSYTMGGQSFARKSLVPGSRATNYKAGDSVCGLRGRSSTRTLRMVDGPLSYYPESLVPNGIYVCAVVSLS